MNGDYTKDFHYLWYQMKAYCSSVGRWEKIMLCLSLSWQIFFAKHLPASYLEVWRQTQNTFVAENNQWHTIDLHSWAEQMISKLYPFQQCKRKCFGNILGKWVKYIKNLNKRKIRGIITYRFFFFWDLIHWWTAIIVLCRGVFLDVNFEYED